MPKKIKNEKAVSPTVGIFLMIVIAVFMALFIVGVVIFLGAGNLAAVPYHVFVTSSEKDHVDVFVSNITTNAPLSDVRIDIYSHDRELLLIGPLYTNDSGLVNFKTQDNFDDHYRVIAFYNGIRYTVNVDKRPFFVKLDEVLGNFSTPLYTAIIALFGAGIAALIAFFKRDWLNAFWKKISNFFKRDDEL